MMLGLSLNYNSVTQTLLAKVVYTRLFACHFNWMLIQEHDWLRQNFVRDGHLDLLIVSANASQSSAMDCMVYDMANSG